MAEQQQQPTDAPATADASSFRLLAEALPIMAWMADRNARLTWCNRACQDFTGFGPERAWTEAVHAEDFDRLNAALLEATRSGNPVRVEYRLRATDGSFHQVADTAAPVYLNGVPVGLAGVTTDLTPHRAAVEQERERAADALSHAESRHRAILESSLDGLIVMDYQGTIVEFNAAAEEMFGRQREEVIGKSLAATVIPPYLRDSHARGLAHYLATGDGPALGRRLEMPALRHDGTEFRVELSIVAIGGTPPMFAGVVRDVTERLRLEAEIRQSQKMQAIGQLAGGVAHDFNNLLTIINAQAEVMLEEEGALTPDQRESVTDIREAGERAALLTRQLLQFARKQVTEPRELQLNEVLEETGKLLRRLIGEDISLTLDLASDLPAIRADPGHVEQLVLNLVLNARDAMPEGGHLRIGTAAVQLNSDMAQPRGLPGRYVRLSVVDSGRGMSPEIRERAFEPFFTTKEAGKGTGLGLATVYGIAQQTGGFVTVSSEEGIGSTFSVYFPALESTPRATRRPTGDSSGGADRGHETILLVEDETAVRRVARLALDERGYRVIEAGSGPEALALTADSIGAIDLCITDVVMPGMSGRQLAERLLSRRPDLNVLYMSGYTADAVLRHGVQDAHVAFLQKPFTPIELARKVRAVLDGRD